MNILQTFKVENCLFWETFYLSPNGNIIYVVDCWGRENVLQIESIDIMTQSVESLLLDSFE